MNFSFPTVRGLRKAKSFALLLLLACAGATRPEGRGFKGWELYSWKDGQVWKFSILEGTNRLKTMDEITSAPLMLGQLCGRIRSLPKGEQLSWTNRFDERTTSATMLRVPSGETIREIQDCAADAGVVLMIASQGQVSSADAP